MLNYHHKGLDSFFLMFKLVGYLILKLK